LPDVLSAMVIENLGNDRTSGEKPFERLFFRPSKTHFFKFPNNYLQLLLPHAEFREFVRHMFLTRFQGRAEHTSFIRKLDKIPKRRYRGLYNLMIRLFGTEEASSLYAVSLERTRFNNGFFNDISYIFVNDRICE
jgi:hypothetical protein